jgi:hypothetical protein
LGIDRPGHEERHDKPDSALVFRFHHIAREYIEDTARSSCASNVWMGQVMGSTRRMGDDEQPADDAECQDGPN